MCSRCLKIETENCTQLPLLYYLRSFFLMIEEDVDKVEREEHMSVVRKLLYDRISAGILQLCLIKK